MQWARPYRGIVRSLRGSCSFGRRRGAAGHCYYGVMAMWRSWLMKCPNELKCCKNRGTSATCKVSVKSSRENGMQFGSHGMDLHQSTPVGIPIPAGPFSLHFLSWRRLLRIFDIRRTSNDEWRRWTQWRQPCCRGGQPPQVGRPATSVLTRFQDLANAVFTRA